MRIQHNIMAMSAYRNYTNNVSAMKKNLEKLSSGYKINRAGDDAAGLAISEKMRAQITGLETAQKNAKDGISLVQTAEGALTEVHDMLNRMVELATQSANGTYDNETDRYQLQKEVDQLRDEINRIADSSNFNGIKLLDGSMSTDAAKITGDARIINDVYTSGSAAELSGTKTFLDGEVATTEQSTIFDVDFNGLVAKDTGVGGGTKAVYESSEITTGDVTTNTATNQISIGGQNIMVTATDTIDDLVTKLNANATLKGNWTFAKDGNDIVATAKTAGAATALTGMTETVKGEAAKAATATIKVAAANSTNATIGSNTNKDITGADATGTDTTNGYSWTTAADPDNPVDFIVTVTTTATGTAANGTTDGIAFTGGADATTAKYTLANAAGAINTALNGSTQLDVDGKKYDVTGADLKAQLTSWANAYNNDAGNTEWTASVNADGNKIVYTAKTAGALGTTGATAPTGATETTAGEDAPVGEVTFDFTIGDHKVSATLTAADAAAGGTADEIADAVLAALGTDVTINGVNYTVAKGDEGKLTFTLADTPTEKNIGANVDWDVTGTNGDSFDGNHTAGVTVTQKGQVHKDAPKANTVFRIEEGDITDGTKITIDGKTVTLAVGKNSQVNTNQADVVDLRYMEEGAINLDQAISEISEAFTGTVNGANGTNWTVGVNDTSNGDTHKGLTVHKANDVGTYDTKSKLASIFSIEKAAGGGLKLQIGDTADSYNQLNVSIKDCHAASLGISGIDISTQEGATAAVDAIKKAINTVSDVRGTLGATQNRLDHTINNLSVMTENIQDAESTIRDVDVAEEMMAYTKNNILIQSAQAMLAQANQVPQGVLQLLG